MSTGPPTLKGPVESACDIRHRRNTTQGNLERTHPPPRFHTRHVRSRHSINPDGRKRRLTAEPTAHERHLPATCSGRFATAGVVGSALPQGCQKRCGPGQTPRPALLVARWRFKRREGVCSAPADGIRLGAAAQKGSFVLASLGRLAHRRAVLRPAERFALTSQLVEPAAIVTPSAHTPTPAAR